MRKYKVKTWHRKMRRVLTYTFHESSFEAAVSRALDEIGSDEVLCVVSMPLKEEEVNASPADVS